MKQHSLFVKTLSVFLALLMAFFVVPISVYADVIEELGKEENPTAPDADADGNGDQASLTFAGDEVFEDTTLREESVKHFRMSDGSYVAYAYGMPIHLLGEDGSWKDIDNTLSPSGENYATPDARIKFAKKITGSKTILTLHEGNHKITLSLDGAIKKTEGVAQNTVTEFDETATLLQKLTTLDRLSSKIVYRDILDGVDLEYIAEGRNIKENIIVKEKSEGYAYTFTLELNNLTASLTEDGSVAIANSEKGDILYRIPAPTAWDANGESAPQGALSYTLAPSGNNAYSLTVTADPDWMNHPDRTFPVTIDPPIYVGGEETVLDVYISQVVDSTTNHDGEHLVVSSVNHVYYKQTELPELDNAFVAKAVFRAYYSTSNAANGLVGVYPVTSTWDDTLTWGKINSTSNPQGTVGSRCYDFEEVNLAANSQGILSFDITALVDDWYANPENNHGICLKPLPDTTFTSRIDIFSSEHENIQDANGNSVNVKPLLIVSYRKMGGVESYWSTAGASAGLAGTSSVNLRLGYLTHAFSGFSTTDAILPYAPTFVYNSTNANAAASLTGRGWTMDSQQQVTTRSYADENGEQQTYYVLLDADGTEHAFMPYTDAYGNTVYSDEDGLGLRVTVHENSTTIRYVVKNQYGDYWYYDANGRLTEYGDIWGNARIFTRNTAGKVTKVSLKPADSPTIDQISYGYNAAGLVSTITYSGSGKQLRFFYSTTYNGTASQSASGYLRKIEFHSFSSSTTALASVEYTYTSGGYLQYAIDNEGKTRLRYNWANGKVTRIDEYSMESGSWTAGQNMEFVYATNGSNQSILRTSGKDNTMYTNDDLRSFYIFDSYGRTVSTYVTGTTGKEIYGSSETNYTENSSENTRTNNRITEQSTAGRTAVNYLANGNFLSSTADWTASGVTLSFDSATKAAKLVNSAGSTSTEKGIYQNVSLAAGTYTFGASVKLPGNNADASVYLKVVNQSTGAVVATSNTFTNATNMGNAAGYIPLSATFTVTTTQTYRFYVVYTTSSTRELYVDDVSLVRGEEAASLSYVKNGSMESTSGWTIFSTGASLNTSVVWQDNKSLRLTGDPDNHSFVRQRYSVLTEEEQNAFLATGEVGTPKTYALSGYGKAESVAISEPTTTTFDLQARVHYLKADGTTNTGDLFFFPFNPNITDWQYVSGTFSGDPDDGIPYQIDIFCTYDYNVGYAYFDDIVLVEAPDSISHEYNDQGNVIKTKQGKSNILVTYEYDENGIDVLKETYSTGIEITRTYQNHQILTETYTDTTGTTTVPKKTYEYNVCGQVIKESSSRNNGSVITQIEYVYNTYEEAYGMIDTVITPTGSTVYLYSTYPEDYGMLFAIMDDNGDGTYYTYDEMGRQIEVLPLVNYYPEFDAEKADMGYNGDKLISVTTDTANYSFTYNANGAQERVKVGTQTIARYLYNAYNGKLRYVVYGNGYIERYDYDILDRISSIWYYSGGSISATEEAIQGYTYTQAAAYIYNGEGKLAEYVDYTTGIREVYRYGMGDMVESVTTFTLDGSVMNVKGKTAYTYDARNRLTGTQKYYTVGTAGYQMAVSMAYDELDRLTQYTEGNFATAYTYNTTGTLNTVTTTASSLSLTYTHLDETKNSLLTGRLSGFTASVKYGNTVKKTTSYTYTYDDRGNITAIRLGGVLKYSYEYDNLNQLIRENNAVAGETYVFTYDNAGNILTKKTYAYTTGTLGTVQDTDTYTYGNSINGDRLMRYNNVSCVIDALGNPLRYANGTNYIMTWQKGRQLAKTVNGGVTTTYTYNADGIRTSKTVGGVTTAYALDGTAILAEQKDGVVIRYFYDANGAPVGFMYNGTRYHYEKNLQGDIVAILNHAGTAFVTYAYDAWGNIVSETYSSNYEYLATANPFRYRGYYYDTETGFYYLQSRYYDPVTCRFINADSHVNANGDLTGYNMYAYCSNNPVMNVDPSGEGFLLSLVFAICKIAIASYGAYVFAKTAAELIELNYDQKQLQTDTINNVFDTATNSDCNVDVSILENYANTSTIDNYIKSCQAAGQQISKLSQTDYDNLYDIYHQWLKGEISTQRMQNALYDHNIKSYHDANTLATTEISKGFLKSVWRILWKVSTFGLSG